MYGSSFQWLDVGVIFLYKCCLPRNFSSLDVLRICYILAPCQFSCYNYALLLQTLSARVLSLYFRVWLLATFDITLVIWDMSVNLCDFCIWCHWFLFLSHSLQMQCYIWWIMGCFSLRVYIHFTPINLFNLRHLYSLFLDPSFCYLHVCVLYKFNMGCHPLMPLK